MTKIRHLVFVSPRFLFPTDSGGKIRTTQILRGMKGGVFRITLVMPARPEEAAEYSDQIEMISDELVLWDKKKQSTLPRIFRRAARLVSRYPVSVISDYAASGARAVIEALGMKPDVVVFDFPHTAVLAPEDIDVPTVMFTHNVECEILERHWRVAKSPLMKAIWRNQYRKMCSFEQSVLSRFDTIVAVSERDRNVFKENWGIDHCQSIPTGVDTEFFKYQLPGDKQQVVFCGSMDWMANIDAIEYFHDRVWASIRRQVPAARMKVVGRSPPESLVKRICARSPEWEFTGFVDDVRHHVGGAAAFVIPLRVAGGTRIKAFEAMSIGSPVVSTTIGVEGLAVIDGTHLLVADEPEIMANKVGMLLNDENLRLRISTAARRLVDDKFNYRLAAKKFEKICLETSGQ